LKPFAGFFEIDHMRFALLGTEKEGVEMASALVATGRHQLLYIAAGRLDPSLRQRWSEEVKIAHDVEEVLADPEVDTVLVASSLSNRAAHLRRALQSERIVLCLHPADTRPDAAYEAGMLQQDTGYLLLPLLPDAFHPAVLRLKELLLIHARQSPAERREDNIVASLPARDACEPPQTAIQVLDHPRTRSVQESLASVLGDLRLIEIERTSSGEVLLGLDTPGALPCVLGWDLLRALGGEIAEVSALAPGAEMEPGAPILLAGRFEKAGLFQVNLLPRYSEERMRIRLTGSLGQAELLFPLGVPGPAFLTWREGGEDREQSWDAWDPWPTMVQVVEKVVETTRGRIPLRPKELPLSWQDSIRSLELDDAARRSVEKRRTSPMEYPEASEEVTFKGTMTLVGCALLWIIIFLAILSHWFHWLGWVAAPVLGVFLLLQLLRWIIPPKETKP
jgi:predicted dehydrogenase